MMRRWIVIICVMMAVLGARAGDLTVDGKLIATDGLDATGNRIENVADPINPTDSANKQYVDIPGYIVASKQGPRTDATLQTIITGLSGTPATIVIDGTWNITSNLTVPANVSLKFWNGGILDVATDIDLAINGNIEAGTYQIFDVSDIGSGMIVCNGNDWSWGEWFGLVKGVEADPACAQNLLALDVAQRGNARIKLGYGDIYINNTLILHQGVLLEGSLPTGSRGDMNSGVICRTAIKASDGFPENNPLIPLVQVQDRDVGEFYYSKMARLLLYCEYKAHTGFFASSMNELGGLEDVEIINIRTYGIHLKSGYVSNCIFKGLRITQENVNLSQVHSLDHTIGVLLENVSGRVHFSDMTIAYGAAAFYGMIGDVSLDDIDSSANLVPTQGFIGVANISTMFAQVIITDLHVENVDIAVFQKGYAANTKLDGYCGYRLNFCDIFIGIAGIPNSGHGGADNAMFVGINLAGTYGSDSPGYPGPVPFLINKYNGYQVDREQSNLARTTIPFYVWKNSYWSSMETEAKNYQFSFDVMGDRTNTLGHLETRNLTPWSYPTGSKYSLGDPAKRWENVWTEGLDVLNNMTVNGYVGIGTSTPSEMLEVAGSTKVTAGLTVGGVASVAGSLGVGTSTPGGKLEVKDGNIRIEHTQGGAGEHGRVEFYASGYSPGSPRSYMKSSRASNWNNGDLEFGTAATTDGAVTRMRIDFAGNVGIGTSTPARKLHISDAMRLQPIATAPANPAEGDIYMDSSTHKLMVYDGAMWQACW